MDNEQLWLHAQDLSQRPNMLNFKFKEKRRQKMSKYGYISIRAISKVICKK